MGVLKVLADIFGLSQNTSRPVMNPPTFFLTSTCVAANTKILLSDWPTEFLASAKPKWRDQLFSLKELNENAIPKPKGRRKNVLASLVVFGR